MLLLLGIACLATYLVMDPLVHPSHHPTLIKFYTYMARFHPRLCQMSGLGLIALAALAQTCTVIGPLYLKYVVRKKGRLGETNLKSARYLDQVISLTAPLLVPQTWQALKNELPGMAVQGADMRRSCWMVVAHDEGRRELQLELRYVHNPLGIKCWRLYPRRLTCAVKLRAKGVSTIVDLKYHADSVMDYRLIYEIIDQTNAAVSKLSPPAEESSTSVSMSAPTDAAFLVPAV
ncbi:MAG: hypothetical protein JSS83_25775 [Cyanobacteria bacterium SZAS LIN-3]|nr:hypothetical protein [Cyanobacteria bacterium SZAS LIN-3]